MSTNTSSHHISKSPQGELPQAAQKRDIAGVASQTCDATMNFIRENLATSTMIAVGLGIGVGIVLSKVIAESVPSPSPQSSMEAFGQRLVDSISTALPDAIAKHLPGN